jgi:hypothetical protein
MSTYPSVRQVDSRGDLRDVREWVGSEPLKDLVRAFGGDIDILYAGDDVGEWLARLDAFSDRWDSRRGAERNIAPPLDLTSKQILIVVEASEALGLMGGRPPQAARYDHILMLGGLLRACVTRPAYAADLILSGRVKAGAVTALGGHRPFGGNEFELARAVGLADVSDEFSALDAGTRRAFGLGEPVKDEGTPTSIDNSAWSIRTYASRDGTPIKVAAAPSSEPDRRRANTADSYEWFARRIAALSAGERLLIVTTAIYVPAQHAAAIRMLGLPFSVNVETVGIQPGDVVPELDQTFTPSQYLQEVRSAVRSLRDLTDVIGPSESQRK